MTVRRRVVVLAVACIVFVGLMAGVMAAGLWISNHMARRVAAIHDRLDVLSQLQAKVGVYGEQAAETMLLGTRTDGFKTIRIDLELLLPRLTQATRAEIATLNGMEEMQSGLPELEEARRIIELYHSIDALMNNALSLQRAGQNDLALASYERRVSFRLTNELLPLLQHAAKEEGEEIAAEIAKAAAASQPLLVSAAAIGGLGLLAIIVLGGGLVRAVVRPIDTLARRVGALAAGEPDAAPGAPLDGEFALLAASLAGLAATVTEERRAFAELGERLTSEVDTRTGQLRAANEQLREIDRRRGQFLTDVSHELRTPLTILRGEADVALRGKGDAPGLRESLERIQGQAAELGNLLEDLIEFARSATEDQPLALADTKLDEIVAAAAQEATMLAAAREVSVAVELADNGQHIDADFRRLKQALMIGLDNAIKHSPPGTNVTVTTSLADGHAKVMIADQGSGVAEADLPRVFERFFRGRDEADTLASGLGIGLGIAKDIIERHGGSIGLANRSEGGAALSILLPVGDRTA